MAKPKIKIRRQAPGRWLVLRPGYGFTELHYTITEHPTWQDAWRSVLAVSLGGAGTFDRDSRRGHGVSVW